MKFQIFVFTGLSILLSSCQSHDPAKSNHEVNPRFQNKGHELVYNMVQKVGNYKLLADKKCVEYTYIYETPDNKKDISQEKYLFKGELSYGKYVQHERTLPQLEGIIEQGYDGQQYWLKHNGKVLLDSNYLKRVAFNRPTNFYWFTMMQKLLDPGLKYANLGKTTLNDQDYDIVRVSFETNNDKPTDIYQLYINRTTLLVDQFLFTVADFGKMETPYLMELEYEEVDGILIPSKRQYRQSTWDASVSDESWTYVTWTNISFDTGLTPETFMK